MKKKRTQKEVHKQALGQQLEDPQTHGVRTKPRKKARTVEAGLDEREAIDAGQSAVILSLAREQQEEEEQMNARERSGADTSANLGSACSTRHRPSSSVQEFECVEALQCTVPARRVNDTECQQEMRMCCRCRTAWWLAVFSSQHVDYLFVVTFVAPA
jgi:hypothetical protein